MSTTVSYKGSTIATVSNTTKSLATSGTWLEDDITLTDVTASPSLQSKTNIAPTTSSQTITADAGYDGLNSVQINAMPSGSATTPATTITANPSITVSSGGLITATASATQSVTPTVSAGYVSSGTAGTVSVSGSNTSQAPASSYSGGVYKNANNGLSVYIDIDDDGWMTSADSSDPWFSFNPATYDSNLVASNIKSGVTIYGTTGTYSGGGSGIGTLIHTMSLGTLTTTTTAVDTGKDLTVTNCNDYDLLIVEITVDSVVNSRHVGTINPLYLVGTTNATTKNGTGQITIYLNYKADSSGVISSRRTTSQYGVYIRDATYSSSNGGTMTCNVYMSYNSTNTGTLDGTYTARVYGVNLYALIGG